MQDPNKKKEKRKKGKADSAWVVATYAGKRGKKERIKELVREIRTGHGMAERLVVPTKPGTPGDKVKSYA